MDKKEMGVRGDNTGGVATGDNTASGSELSEE